MFVEEAVSKVRAFYFDKFLPFVVPCLIISQSCKQSTTAAALVANNCLVKRTPIALKALTESCDNVELLCVSAASRPLPPSVNVLYNSYLHTTHSEW